MASLQDASAFHSYQPATSDQWLAIKPIFVRLYIDENWKLDDVRRELAEKHNFRATEKAFKRRITIWKAFKNYKAAEKDQLAKHKTLVDSSQETVVELQIRGKSVKWDRVHRHQRDQAMKKKQQAKFQHPQGTLAYESFKSKTTSVLPRRLSDRHSIALLAAENFCAWTASENYPKCTHKRSLEDSLDDMLEAVDLISQRHPRTVSQSWRTVHNACKMLARLVMSGTEHIIWPYMLYLSNHRHNSLSEALFRYIWHLCHGCLNRENPLIQLLRTTASQESVQDLQRMAFKIYYRNAWIPTYSGNNYRGDNILATYFDGAIRSGYMYETREVLDQMMNLPGINGDMKRCLLQLNVDMLKKCGDFELAIIKHRELIEALSGSTTRSAMIRAYYGLAVCHEQLGDQINCIKYRKLALRDCFHEWGPSALFTVWCFDLLVETLQDLGAWDELRELEETYWPAICAVTNASLPTEEELDRMDSLEDITDRDWYDTAPDEQMQNEHNPARLT